MATTTRLVPWVRRGLTTALTAADPLSGGGADRAQIDVRVSINGTYADSVQVALLGPGDVTALGDGQVLRSDPAPGAFDVEPNYFTFVELASAALPWLFTPYAHNGDALRPWLVLVVVSTQEAELSPASEQRPAILRTTSGKLPDLDQSHLWAHAEFTESDAAGTPKREIARLMCGRKLSPDTDYIAAVVPAFESGRRSALGLDPNVAGAAWDVSTDAAVELPVLHSWTFRTGAGGDFETLASRLGRVPSSGLTSAVAATVPRLPGSTAGPAAGWDCDFPGALGTSPTNGLPATYVTRLSALVNGARATGLPVAPTMYGRWLGAVSALTQGTGPDWVWDLNANPQFRVAAALGVRFVQDNQEDLMAAAWRQIGDVERANALIKASQLARASSAVVHRRLSSLSPAALLVIVGPLITRVIDDSSATPQTLQATVRASVVPEALVSPAVRRVLRPRGPLSRRSMIRVDDILTAVNTGTRIVPARSTPDGMLTVAARDISSERLEGAAGDWVKRGPASARSQRKDVVIALRELLDSLGSVTTQPSTPPLALPAIASTLIDAMDPTVTIPRRVGHRIQGPPGWAPADPLTPILACPRIDTPLSQHLISTSPRWLLPGIADLPDDSVTAVPTNRHFVEALMVGANHEFGRELLWRGYPTDQRGTAFHRFWDTSVTAGGPRDDIDDIDAWTGALGTHVAAGSDEFVLLVRGQLLRRYPDTIMYASRAEWDTSVTPPVRRLASTPKEVFPSFRGTISPDITYAGFDLPTSALGRAPTTGDAGWFFVFLQPPTQMRFGLDTAPDVAPATVPTGWDGLDWGRVETTQAGYFRVGVTAPTGIPAADWTGLTSATLAVGCRQKRFRAAIHATDLVLP